MSVHIFWGVLYYICEIDQISPPPTLASAHSKIAHGKSAVNQANNHSTQPAIVA